MSSQRFILAGARATAVPAVVLLIALTQVAHAEPPPKDLVISANEALQRGEFDRALELYDQADKALPDSPELAYNKAVAHYRKGEYDKAAELFAAAGRAADPKLDAKARFNQGNCAYASALAKRDNVQEAISNLQSAIAHYKDAIEADPTDRDPRANIEMAQLLMKDLLDRKNQEQQKQQESKDKQDQQEGEQKDQQEGGEQQDQQQQNGEEPQDQGQKKQPGQQQQEQEQEQQPQGGQKQDQQEQQPQQEQGQAQEQQQSQPNDGSAPQQKDGKPGEPRQLSKEEAQRLLQLIRDKELQRRQELARRTRAKLVPVEKDW